MIRDRVKEVRRVRASDLAANPRNWRLHPYAQRAVLAEVLERVGVAGALLAYESQRNGGALTLIDGHARVHEAPEVEWPVVVLDVSDEEADLLLATLDPMVSLAEPQGDKLGELLADIQGGSPGLEDLLQELRALVEPEEPDENSPPDSPAAEVGPPEMELQAFEHYDYIVLLFRDARDWSRAKDLFGLRREGFTIRDGARRRVGLGRVVDGRRLFQLLDRPSS
ncbi:MAG: hypothetical protein QN122_12105 [Armatimonadota bacterium]|nr:hypothetical protein [Armatimonadota bacterium]